MIAKTLSRHLIRVLLLLIVFTVLMKKNSSAQNIAPNTQNVANPVDIIDVLKRLLKKNDTLRNEPQAPTARNLSLLPVLGYSPANGFVIGAAVSVTKRLGSSEKTRLSSALVNVSFTTKKQILLNLRSDLHLSNNEWYIPGDIRFLFFAQPTYGLGIYGLHSSDYKLNIDGMNLKRTLTEQPMRFNYIRVYETAVRKLFNTWYAGLGINIDYHYNIRDQALKLDTPAPYISSHYIYSKKYGFDTAHYSTNGLSLQIIQDSRDNSVNAYTGYYANLTFRFNPQFLGSNQNSSMLFFEWRNYIGLQKSNPRHLLAFWAWGQFVTSGNVPYLALPSITWDTYNRSGRGYIQGRFRGKDMVYAESEYRFPITKNGLLGGVTFVNITTASNPLTSQSVFNSVAPAYGVGLRIMMNKRDRTNICIDYGVGNGSNGIYFNIRETF
jgi:outer membrane protein assembly factor BamA